MLENFLFPPGYNETAQILISISTGVIFSAFTAAISAIILFLLLFELVLYMIVCHNKYTKWKIVIRICVLFGYFFGWFVGRYVHSLNIEF